jgi:DNA processing protein
MTADGTGTAAACAECLRRGWLLGQLLTPLDYCARDRDRLLSALALHDRELLAALAGRRRRELEFASDGWRADTLELPAGVETVCRHTPRYPARLRADAAPRALFVAGGGGRLAELVGGSVVTVLGATRASDYGVEMTARLARGLAASGVTVAAPLAAGVGACALRAARDLGAGAIAALAGGAGSASARTRSHEHAIAEQGCVISELPPRVRGRRFGELAAERTLAHIGDVLVVVEARADASEVATARALLEAGSPVAALPGRAASPLAAGAHALIRDGATLVRDARDVLELLPASCCQPGEVRGGPESPGRETACRAPPALARPLAAVLERVAEGCDTVERLCAESRDADATLLALSELEVLGLLGRGAGGRYIARATPCN